LRFLFHLLAMFGVALAVGFGLSWYALEDGRLFGALQVGPWAAWPQAGAVNPDPYTRAFLARTGAMQLGQSEGLQFVAHTDSDGQALDRDCRYRIDGTTPLATFWTLVPETPEGSPIARPDGPAGFNSQRLSRAADGSAILYVGKALSPYNWIEITGEGSFALVLTFYDIAVIGGAGEAIDRLPAIIREACA
jgi:hypothetical protein